MQYDSISFDNTELAFHYKNDQGLKDAKKLFSLMSNSFLVKWGTKITPWALQAGLPIKNALRNTIFKQFVGGENLEQTKKVVETLAKYHVQVILDYAVEGGDGGDAEYDQATDEFIKVIDYAALQSNIPFMSVKVTGITRFALLEKIDELMEHGSGDLEAKYNQALNKLNTSEREAWEKVVARIDRISFEAREKNVGALFDAEETWIQDPIDAVINIMMEKYNKEKPIVYNTAQLYRHDRLQFLKDSYELAVRKGFILGMKLVRGAYMEKERARAMERGYPSPIQPDKQSTNRDFDAAAKFCIDHLDQISVIISTHNENSNLIAVEELKKSGKPMNHPHANFSQLYGMSDHITFNLAHAGCNVTKYLPFGPIERVTPYLMRRAEENTSVKGQTGRELSLIKKELQRRSL